MARAASDRATSWSVPFAFRDVGDFALFQFVILENLEDVVPDLRARHELVGVFQTKIGEDVSGALIRLYRLASLRAHVPNASQRKLLRTIYLRATV